MSYFQFLFEHETVHFVVSAIIALLLWRIYSNRWVIVVSLIAGLLIDLDHLFDYAIGYLSLIGPTLDLSKIVLFDYMSAAGKVFVFFHSLDFIWIWNCINFIFSSSFQPLKVESIFLPFFLISLYSNSKKRWYPDRKH